MLTVAAAASTWTNIGAKLSPCAGDLDKVCSSRLAGQESLAVATSKTLQPGSASHLLDDVGTASARMDSQTIESAAKRADDLAQSAQHRIKRQLTTDSGDDIRADSVTTDGTITKGWDAKHTVIRTSN